MGCLLILDDERSEKFVDNPYHAYDGDGILSVPVGTDCDDRGPDIGLPRRYYKDEDNDGFGTESDSTLTCPNDLPTGYVRAKQRTKQRNDEVVFDCNDDADIVHPEAEEICYDQDNDCNGQEEEVDTLRVNARMGDCSNWMLS